MTKFPDATSLTTTDLSTSHLASESFEDWDKLLRINTSSIFFSTMTFLPSPTNWNRRKTLSQPLSLPQPRMRTTSFIPIYRCMCMSSATTEPELVSYEQHSGNSVGGGSLYRVGPFDGFRGIGSYRINTGLFDGYHENSSHHYPPRLVTVFSPYIPRQDNNKSQDASTLYSD